MINEKDSQLILQHLLTLAIELSAEHNTHRLLEKILESAISLTQSQGGTIYSVNENDQLSFETLINKPLNLHMGGTTNRPITFPCIPIYRSTGEVNESAVVAISAANQEVICIDDVYECNKYDLSAARAMDAKTGFRTQSVLTVPLSNHEDELNGVMQLINPCREGTPVPFTSSQIEIICSIAALAAVAVTNRQLIDDMESLFKAITRLIANAIDEKSPYTGGHCRRVPELTMMIAKVVSAANYGPLKDFILSDDDAYELSIAGWLHDCGKIAIPEYVMDKATKLQSVHDNIALVDAKIELAKRDIEIAQLKKQLSDHGISPELSQPEQIKLQLEALDEDREFLRKSNIGGEYMPPSAQARVQEIADKHVISIGNELHPLLSKEQVYNLSIAKGTLTPEEREIINKHMSITIDMLEALPFPKHLKRVVEFAGGHHEKMDGTGYPKGLTREQMSVPARIMAIADKFEALSASDRPYKEPKTLSECLFIMGKMKEEQHIDPDIFDIFVDSEVYLEYANKHLQADQIDEIQIEKIPNYLPKNTRY